ncbi:uncharacterized protein TNCV_312151 [Trichonephila clavipes]|nr:uncharacterized protein TNCV_312151 [Trichonephila clavipes]
MENSSEGIDSEILYSVKLFMDIDFQGILGESQLYFKLPPDRSSYLRMINAKKKEGFPPDPGTIVLRQKDINLITGKPFRIKTCCSSQMLINTLREDTVYLLDLQEFEPGDASRDLSFVRKGKYCRKEQRGIVGQQIDFVLKWLSRVGSEVGKTKDPPASCKMTSAHGHGAIVYCLNSGSDDSLTGRHNGKGEPVSH